jgi:hypothetical protein
VRCKELEEHLHLEDRGARLLRAAERLGPLHLAHANGVRRLARALRAVGTSPARALREVLDIRKYGPLEPEAALPSRREQRGGVDRLPLPAALGSRSTAVFPLVVVNIHHEPIHVAQ